MGVPIVEGREFDERDRFAFTELEKSPTVAVVNRAFARRFFGTETAVGRHFGVGDRKHELGVEIVGVVEDALHAGPRTGIEPQVFFSFLQTNFPVDGDLLRTDRDRAQGDRPGRFAARWRTSTRRCPIYAMKTMERQLDDTLSAERLIASLAVAFAALATVMAALGLYGVMAFAVARRTKEIGLRTALGASPGSVLWLVMREVFRLLGAGMLIGVPCAVLLSRVVASQLFGVTPTDVWTAAAAAATLVAVAVAAGLLPARARQDDRSGRRAAARVSRSAAVVCTRRF